MNCFVLSVDGVLCVGRCLLSICYGAWTSGRRTWGPRVADVGAGRVATTIAVLCACVRSAARLFYHSPWRTALANRARGCVQESS